MENQEKLKLSLPLEVYVGKKKFILNLNNYRNAHYRTLNDAKNNYTALIWDRLPSAPIPFPVSIEFIYYPKSGRRVDPSNPISIIEKFTCDALVKKGCLPDDDYTIIQKHLGWTYGGIDKENPRCEIIIKKI